MSAPTITTLLYGNQVGDFAWFVTREAIETGSYASAALHLEGVKRFLMYTQGADFKTIQALDGASDRLERAATDPEYAAVMEKSLADAKRKLQEGD